MFFFDAKLRFALLASFRYRKIEQKRSEANQKISKNREAKLRVELPNNFILTRIFASRFLLIFDSPRFASAHYFRAEIKHKARSEASRQKKHFLFEILT